MKKLLALVLVLGMSSMASAFLIQVDGPATLMPGEKGVYTYSIADDGGRGGLNFFDVYVEMSNDLATLTDATFLATTRNAVDYDYNGIADNPAEFAFGADSGGLDALMSIEVTAGAVPGVFDIVTTGVYFADITWDDTFMADFAGGAGIQIVPEPITMTLLGLGGLLAVRRRR